MELFFKYIVGNHAEHFLKFIPALTFLENVFNKIYFEETLWVLSEVPIVSVYKYKLFQLDFQNIFFRKLWRSVAKD